MFVTLEILYNLKISPTPGNLEFFNMTATDLGLAPIDAAQRAASIGISEIPQNAKSTFFWACKVITCCAALRAAQLFPFSFFPPLLPYPLCFPFSLEFPPPFPMSLPLKTGPQAGSGILGQAAVPHWGARPDWARPGRRKGPHRRRTLRQKKVPILTPKPPKPFKTNCSW